jgi:hypothetical protein
MARPNHLLKTVNGKLAMKSYVGIHKLIILRRSKVTKLGIHPDAKIPSFDMQSHLQDCLVCYGQEGNGNIEAC